MSDENELAEGMQVYQGALDDPGDDVVARRDLAKALRDLVHATGGGHVAPARLREIAEGLRAQARALAEAGEDRRPSPTGTPAAVPGMEDFHDRSPITGRSNALAPPATLGVDADAGIVVGEVTFGRGFEGAPGCVHGGFVSAVLDEALGLASVLCGTPCMTAELVTRYRKNTPIETLLRIEARLVSSEGRKVRCTGELVAGETVVAEAEGLFIAVDVEKFKELLGAREGEEQ